ncbi:MAG: exonuclease domain-containing protein, partial [Pseudonocardiaceae bacterium]
MTWAQGPLCGLDLETTDTDPAVARIVTASVVCVHPGREPVVASWLVAVDDPIPAESTLVHGVTTGHAREHGRPLADVAREVTGALVAMWGAGAPVVVHNAPYDLTVLGCERRRLGLPPVPITPETAPVVDPLVCDRAVDRYRR